MAITPDQNIQKIFSPKSLLPQITPDGTYSVRYRVVSENGNQVSFWSPKYIITKAPISSNVTSDKTILNPDGTSIPKYDVTYLAKSHGQSIDVSWKIRNTYTDLIEVPKAIEGLQYDAFVRWGGDILSISGTTIKTISLNYTHNLKVGQTVIFENHINEDQLGSFIVKTIVSDTSFTIDTTGVSFNFTIKDWVWTAWELIATITNNSFSVPIPETHQSTATAKRRAEFMIHLATTTKNVDVNNYGTLLFYTDSMPTEAQYGPSSSGII